MSTKLKKSFWMTAVLIAQVCATQTWAIEAKLFKPWSWVPAAQENISDVPQLENDDMGPTELRQTIMGFNAQVVSGQVGHGSLSAGYPTFQITGKIFDSCAAGVNVVSGQTQSEEDGTLAPWVQVQDPRGAMRVCQQKMLSLGYHCDATYSCRDLSSFANSRISLQDYDTGQVLLMVGGKPVPFDSPVMFKGSFDRIHLGEKKRKAEAARLHEPEVNKLEATLTDCPTDINGVSRQRRALEKLSRIEGVLDNGEWSQLKREIDKNELKVLSELARSSPTDELPQVMHRLSDVESIDTNVAASVYVHIADTYARSTESHSLHQAVDTIDRARRLSGLSDHNRVTLDSLYFDYRIKDLREYAIAGVPNVSQYQHDYVKLSGELEKRRQEVCGRGVRSSTEACTNVTQEVEDMRQVPADAQQGIQNRLQQQYYRGPSSVTELSLKLYSPSLYGQALWW